jgi:hypothetical protein
MKLNYDFVGTSMLYARRSWNKEDNRMLKFACCHVQERGQRSRLSGLRRFYAGAKRGSAASATSVEEVQGMFSRV